MTEPDKEIEQAIIKFGIATTINSAKGAIEDNRKIRKQVLALISRKLAEAKAEGRKKERDAIRKEVAERLVICERMGGYSTKEALELKWVLSVIHMREVI